MSSGIIKVLHGIGGLLVLSGAAFQFFDFDFAKYVFAAGTLILIVVQSIYLMQAKHKNVRIQRIVRMMFFATLLLGIGVYLMFILDDRWVIMVLIYALVSVFLAWRSGGAKENSL